MADEHRDSHTRLLRELYFNRTGIVFLLMVLASVLMLFASARTHGSVSQFWLALGSAILATTGYSFVQVLLTTRQFNQFISGTKQTDVKNEITRSTDEALRIFRSSQTRYLPSKTYPPQGSTNPEFNRDLNLSLSKSTRYVFRGMTARYAVARLALLGTVPREVRLIVADPTKSAALDFRARHEAGSGDEAAFNHAKKAFSMVFICRLPAPSEFAIDSIILNSISPQCHKLNELRSATMKSMSLALAICLEPEACFPGQ